MDELSPYLRAYASERAAGENVFAAYQVARLGILTSRNFLAIRTCKTINYRICLRTLSNFAMV